MVTIHITESDNKLHVPNEAIQVAKASDLPTVKFQNDTGWNLTLKFPTPPYPFTEHEWQDFAEVIPEWSGSVASNDYRYDVSITKQTREEPVQPAHGSITISIG